MKNTTKNEREQNRNDFVGGCEHMYSWIQLSPKEKGKMNMISNFQCQEN